MTVGEIREELLSNKKAVSNKMIWFLITFILLILIIAFFYTSAIELIKKFIIRKVFGGI